MDFCADTKQSVSCWMVRFLYCRRAVSVGQTSWEADESLFCPIECCHVVASASSDSEAGDFFCRHFKQESERARGSLDA